MAAVGPVLAASADSNLVPVLMAIGAVLLGGGGIAGILTARAQGKNYVQTGYKDLTAEYRAAAAEARADAAAAAREADDERAAKERAEYARDRWRAYSYALRDELAAHGVVSKAIPPTDHPSEAP
jgi:hypothetical protein